MEKAMQQEEAHTITKRWKDVDWCRTMTVTYDYNNMMASLTGEGAGISETMLEKTLSRVDPALLERFADGSYGFAALPHQKTSLLKTIETQSDSICARYLDFIVLGIGGSALGSILLQRSLNHPFYNHLTRVERGFRPRIFIPDNIDPDRLESLLDIITPERTFLNVITKSGNTAETLANFSFLLEVVKKNCGEGWRDNLLFTTGGSSGTLRKMADKEGIASFEIPEEVGGRFSVLSPVGLLSAAVGGIDIHELLAGARDMKEKICSCTPARNPAVMMAIANYIAFTELGKPILVVLPYSQALKELSDWFSQLWAESLGKKNTRDGSEVYAGQTPVKALGATDQHSQLQLYMEGPRDKTILFIKVERFHHTAGLSPRITDDIGIPLLGGRSLRDLIRIEQEATEFSLASNGVMNQSIHLPEINPYTMGQLIFLLESATALCGELLNINAFDQPGVEQGKRVTYALLGDERYTEEKRTAEAFRRKKKAQRVV
jgi:glucose-6-phosphate isomerase